MSYWLGQDLATKHDAQDRSPPPNFTRPREVVSSSSHLPWVFVHGTSQKVRRPAVDELFPRQGTEMTNSRFLSICDLIFFPIYISVRGSLSGSGTVPEPFRNAFPLPVLVPFPTFSKSTEVRERVPVPVPFRSLLATVGARPCATDLAGLRVSSSVSK